MSSPRFTWERLTLKLVVPFRLSYGISTTREVFWLRLAGDEGWGESAIPPYYAISQAAMVAYWQDQAQRTDPFPDTVDAISHWVGDQGPAPARCALDLALHDRLARQRGGPLYELLGLPRPQPRPTAFTIPIAEPQAMARMAQEVATYPVLKIKLGSEDDVARVAAVRAARPDAIIYLDANGAWSPSEAVDRIRALEPYAIALVEQPVPKEDIEGMGRVQARVQVPLVADESVQTLAHVDALARVGVQGLNIKLMKVGGLGPALAMIRRAREQGMRIMLGCMIETSLGVTAMAHLMALADWLDLDAPLLIGNDPFQGVRYDARARVHLPSRAGIGVVLTEKVISHQ